MHSQMDDGRIKVYTRKSGFSGTSYVISNQDVSRTLRIVMDCNPGKNVISHRGTLLYAVVIPPGEAKVNEG